MKQSDKENLVSIIYVDNHILIVDKPSDLLTQPNETNSKNLEDLSKAWIKKEYKKTGNVFLHAVHRIDKPVSGLVLFARTSKALSRLNMQIREHKIERIYRAEVEGVLKDNIKTLKHYIAHKRLKAEVFDKENKDAKEAILTYKIIKQKKDRCLIEIKLLTGRYHQIRAQLSYIGHPIVGDAKYHSKIHSDHIMLNHYNLQFIHPVTNQQMEFFSRIIIISVM